MGPWQNLDAGEERAAFEQLRSLEQITPPLRERSTMVQRRPLTCFPGELRRAIDQGRRPPHEVSWLALDDGARLLDGRFATLRSIPTGPHLREGNVAEYAWLVSRYGADAIEGLRIAEHVDEVLYRISPNDDERTAVADVVHRSQVTATAGGWRVSASATADGEVIELDLSIAEDGDVHVSSRRVLLEAPSVCAVRRLV